jgi:hypothetical protein
MTAVDVADMLYAVLLAIVVVVGIKYISAIFQAWAQKSSDRQFRLLAEKAVASQSETQAALTSMQGDLSRIASSLAAVETLLRQVE